MTRPRTGPRRGHGRRAVAGALLALLPLSACAAEKVSVPTELRGTWVTRARAYEDRAMEFLEEGVVFHASEERYTIHPIASIEASDGDGRTRYAIVYSNEGRRIDAALLLEEDGSLVFEHQRAVRWVRSSR